MKRTLSILATVAGLSCAANEAQIVVPSTTIDLNAHVSFERGELAVVHGAESAALFVGSASGEALPVVDATALRGTMTRGLLADEFVVQPGPGVASIADGAWGVTASAASNLYLRVYPLGGASVSGVRYEMDAKRVDPLSGQLMPVTSEAGFVDCGEYWQLDLPWNGVNALTATVSNIAPWRVTVGAAVTNDATVNTWLIKDTSGVYNLADLRPSLRDYTYANRAETWWQYSPGGTVRMNGERAAWNLNSDATHRFLTGWEGESFGWWLGGGRILSVGYDGSAAESTVSAIAITAFDATTRADGYITLTVDIAYTGAFDADTMRVIAAAELNSTEWYEVSATKTLTADTGSVATYTLKATAPTSQNAFFKVAVGGVASQAIVVFRADVRFAKSITVAGDATIGGASVTNLAARLAAVEDKAESTRADTVSDASVTLGTDSPRITMWQPTDVTLTVGFGEAVEGRAVTMELLIDLSGYETAPQIDGLSSVVWLGDEPSFAAGTRELLAFRVLPDGTVLGSTQGAWTPATTEGE